jgi:hypothetical protein
MLQVIVDHVKRAAKAYVAAAAPIIANAAAQLVTELNTAVTNLVAVIVGAVVVYLVPNSE